MFSYKVILWRDLRTLAYSACNDRNSWSADGRFELKIMVVSAQFFLATQYFP